MIQKYGVPYTGGMFCTDRMKLVPFTKYCNEKYGKGNCETWLGIRADEPKRLSKKKALNILLKYPTSRKKTLSSGGRKCHSI